MRRTRVIGALLVIVLLLLGACAPEPTPPPPTPTPPMVPPGPSTITILSPQEKSEVPWHYQLEGKVPEVILGSGLNVYVLVYPIESNGPWWVQPPVGLHPDGSWEAYAYFGRDPLKYPQDVGDQFYVITIATGLRLEPGQQWHFLPDFEYKSDLIQVRRE